MLCFTLILFALFSLKRCRVLLAMVTASILVIAFMLFNLWLHLLKNLFLLDIHLLSFISSLDHELLCRIKGNAMTWTIYDEWLNDCFYCNTLIIIKFSHGLHWSFIFLCIFSAVKYNNDMFSVINATWSNVYSAWFCRFWF
jgi:hypothetical protein